jgi:hypothetical protein
MVALKEPIQEVLIEKKTLEDCLNGTSFDAVASIIQNGENPWDIETSNVSIEEYFSIVDTDVSLKEYFSKRLNTVVQIYSNSTLLKKEINQEDLSIFWNEMESLYGLSDTQSLVLNSWFIKEVKNNMKIRSYKEKVFDNNSLKENSLFIYKEYIRSVLLSSKSIPPIFIRLLNE